MLSASQAMRLGVATGRLCATVALERTLHSLPSGTGKESQVKAHWILRSLIEKSARDAERALTEVDLLLGGPPGFAPAHRPWKDAADVRKPIVEAAAALVAARSFEALTFALSLSASDLYVAGRTADSVGMVLDLVSDGSARARNLRKRFEASLAQLSAARTSLIGAGRLFRRALAGKPLSPAVGEASGKLSRFAHEPLPTFDGEKSRYLYRAGETWWSALSDAIRTLERSFTFPAEPAARPRPSDPEAAALADLLARPDDDDARERWAALAESRQEPRAVLVREQMKVRKERREPPHWARWESALARSLVERHGKEWGAPVRRLGAKDVAFRRGFVEWISIDAAVFLSKAPALYRAAPILHVKLEGAAPLLRELVASGSLSRLVALDVSDQGLEDSHAELLATAGLTQLRALHLTRNGLTEAGVRALYTSTSLPLLAYCPLDGNRCEPLYETGWTLEEYPREEWVRTDLGIALLKELGKRRWAFPWAQEWPPDLDILTMPIPAWWLGRS